MIKNTHFLVISFALCGLALLTCTVERQPCLTPTIASLNIECMHLPTDTATIFIDTALPSAVFTALTPTRSDSTIYPQQSLFTLSLSPDTTYCQWQFITDTALSKYAKYDVITFRYQRDLQFLSNSCGYAYFYTLDTVYSTHNIIDSLHLINTSVTNDVNTTHVQIFIHPDY